MDLSRRTMLRLASSGLWVPSSALASPPASTGERKFLFVLAYGGWDTARVFTPLPSGYGYDRDEDGVSTASGDLTWLSGPSRPAVDTFFERWGDQVCMLNGMEIPSISHTKCFQLLFTGRGDDSRDDWGCVLGAHSEDPDLLLPYLVFDGPTYTRLHPEALVRLGDTGQLPALLTGTIFERATTAVTGLESDAEALADAFIAARSEAWAEGRNGLAADLGERYARSLSHAEQLAIEIESLNLDGEVYACGRDLVGDAEVVLECMAAGLSRCALLQDMGQCGHTWDTHSNDEVQDANFEDFFTALDTLLEMLATTTALSGAPLSEEVTVVVISEMSRTPFLNFDTGREHWTYTSAMLIGSGIRGGQTIGRMDDDYVAERVSLESGELDDDGDVISAAHLGATLLELGGVTDPTPYVSDVPPIAAALS